MVSLAALCSGTGVFIPYEQPIAKDFADFLMVEVVSPGFAITSVFFGLFCSEERSINLNIYFIFSLNENFHLIFDKIHEKSRKRSKRVVCFVLLIRNKFSY